MHAPWEPEGSGMNTYIHLVLKILRNYFYRYCCGHPAGRFF